MLDFENSKDVWVRWGGGGVRHKLITIPHLACRGDRDRECLLKHSALIRIRGRAHEV